MGKKSANNAIDFQRLFAMKEQPPPAPVIAMDLEAMASNNHPSDVTPREVTTTSPERAGEVPAQSTDDAPLDSSIRIGMPRDLHDRVRALAALRNQSPTDLVRSLFERVTPVFDVGAPLATLATLARDAVPMLHRDRRVDVRMQLAVSAALHRRLHQFAALRAQTLGACMLDVLEANAPSLQ